MASYWETISSQRVRRRRALQVAAVSGTGLAAAALVGCGGDSGSSGSASSSGSETGELAEKQVVRQVATQDLIPLDPATLFRIQTEEIAYQIYDALVTYDATGKIVKDLAVSWEQPDPTTFIFKLANGVKFHKGYGDMTSADVLYSFNRILDPAVASTYKNQFQKVDSFSAPDAQTVTIKLKGPDVNFLHQVANYHQGQIVSKKAIEEKGKDYGFSPVGSGPYQWESYTPTQEVVLVKNPDYFQGPATIERIHFRFIPDAETAAIAFQNNELEMLGAVTNTATFDRLKADPRVALNISDAGGNVSVGLFNGRLPRLMDARVRKAYIHAIDRDAVMKVTSPISGRAWDNIIPGWMDIYNKDVAKYSYDVATSKQLLSAAGLKENELQLKYMVTEVGEDHQLYQSYLAKAGIKLDFEIVDSPTYNSRRGKGEFEISQRSLPAVNPDDLLFGYLHPDFYPPTGYNAAYYNNATVNGLLEKARAEVDFERRKSMYFEVQKLAMADAPYMPRSNNTSMEIAFKWISGVAANPLTNMLYYGMKVLKS